MDTKIKDVEKQNENQLNILAQTLKNIWIRNMKVKLIILNQLPLKLLTTVGELEDVVAIAKLSNPSNQNNTETSIKLLKYLITRALVSF